MTANGEKLYKEPRKITKNENKKRTVKKRYKKVSTTNVRDSCKNSLKQVFFDTDNLLLFCFCCFLVTCDLVVIVDVVVVVVAVVALVAIMCVGCTLIINQHNYKRNKKIHLLSLQTVERSSSEKKTNVSIVFVEAGVFVVVFVVSILFCSMH